MHDVHEPASPEGDGGFVRLRLDLGYDGTDFAGWALQPGQRTVQGEIEQALARIARVQRVPLVVAGRTDAGVHATGQVAHCELDARSWRELESTALRRLAGILPADVRVYSIRAAADGFDARFSAVWRRYRYRLTDADAGPDPLRRHDTAAWKRRVDVPAMQAAAEYLLGLHDFAAYCRRRDGATTIRTLQGLTVTRTGPVVQVEVQADAFCHSMVRSLVGALGAVGEGRRPVRWPAGLLSRRERSEEVTVAPARGLTLLEVGYPADAELAERARLARAIRTL